MDETIKYREELVRTADELKRLSLKRQDLVRQYDAEQKSLKPRYNESEQAAAARKNTLEVDFHTKLVRLEEEMHQVFARERNAREQLAESSRKLDEQLRAVETRAYATTRPPLGPGLRLTEQDYRQAQKSIPPFAFFMAISAVVFVSVVANSNPDLPLELTIAQSLLGLAVPTVIGLRANYYAKRNDRRAEEQLKMQRDAAKAEFGAERDAPDDLVVEAKNDNDQ
ncbi:hypothetical protein QFZ23_004265 [Arthrobacter globiformis]|uniref:hypothetical protein n=1 Tax=Arthrobacter globiformis TaxID=1665 RepID=UPI0027807594|nr:hypothetical protein [Arthrobacter globiformis]MDQ1060364.1 hypothetical protein [Arthrobacter globiformis]